MSNRTKNILYSVGLLTAAFLVYQLRKAPTPIQFEGPTMGTTYHVTYFDEQDRNFQPAVDSILKVFNKCLSTYDTASDISRFNAAAQSYTFNLPFFYPMLVASQEIVTASHGAFDPTVGPIANIWGFGEDKGAQPDSAQIDSIMTFVGFEKILFNKDSVWKTDPRVKLNFNAIAPGYASDLVADFLKARGITNLFVEIGGEVVVAGTNLQSGEQWNIGILDPLSTYEKKIIRAYARLQDKGMTTSGNYFNYRVVDGRKVSHTLDPQTGYPLQRNILSASVFANDCTTADGWSTAFMVMGYEKGLEVLKEHPDLNVLFIYSKPDGTLGVFASDGIKNQLTYNESL